MLMQTFWLLTTLLTTPPASVQADYVIAGVEIHDGSGGPARRGDLAIAGERIMAVGRFEVAGEPRRIDGAGLIAAPGFIDVHTHCDGGITKDKTRLNQNYLTQGVTTVVTGNCGGGPADVGRFLQDVDRGGAGTNVAHLVPHGAVRSKVMGGVKRPPTADELERMKQLVAAGMRDGAWGMSTGLIYTPGCYADTDELVELSQVVARHGGLYVSHIRGEGEGLPEAVREAIAIGQRAGLPVHISHFKASGPAAWGLSADAIRQIQAARDAGRIVTADQYPYVASSTSLAAMVVPEEYRSKARLADALADPQQAANLRGRVTELLAARTGGKSLVVASYPPNRSFQGQNLADLAQQRQCSLVDLVLEIQQNGGASMVNFGMQEDEVRRIMQFPQVATASDGGSCVPDATVPHPRNYGCFPRKIGRYAIEWQVLSLEAAIRSATGLPADVFGFDRRGYLHENWFADVVVFDPQTFRDTATFEQPHHYATGVRYLFVNGRLAIDDGQVTSELAGRALRHGAATPAVAEDAG